MKRIIKLSLVAVFACVAGYNVYQSQKKVSLSVLNLANIEALANNEDNPQECSTYISGERREIFSDGAYRIVTQYDCSGGGLGTCLTGTVTAYYTSKGVSIGTDSSLSTLHCL